jgi:hypothetical protein
MHSFCITGSGSRWPVIVKKKGAFSSNSFPVPGPHEWRQIAKSQAENLAARCKLNSNFPFVSFLDPLDCYVFALLACIF